MSTPADKCHFFRLPLELRDEIYDLVAAKEDHIALRIDLNNERQQPEVHAYTVDGLGSTCSELKRRVKTITAAADTGLVEETLEVMKDQLVKLGVPGSDNCTVSNVSRLHVSQTRYPRRGTVIQKTHALTIPVLHRAEADVVLVKQVWDRLLEDVGAYPHTFDILLLKRHVTFTPLAQQLLYTFVADAGAELATNVSFEGPAGYGYPAPTREAKVALEHIVEAVDAVDWSGLANLYRLWQSRVGRKAHWFCSC